MRPAGDSTRSHLFLVFAIVFAGETVFSLPFHVTRYFRPAMLDGLGLNNAQLGDLFAVYGVTAMLAYFPGGWIADRYGARTLMSIALCATALGGLYLLSGPGYGGLAMLYGYWGVTSILLFWSAMIKARISASVIETRPPGPLNSKRSTGPKEERSN